MSYKARLLVLGLTASTIVAASACGVDRSSSVLSPSSVATVAATNSPAGSGSTRSLIGTWVSVNNLSAASITGLPMLSSCSNFQLTIVSQTATAATGQFSAACPGNMSVTGTIVAQLGGATIPLVFTGTAAQGGDTCAFTLNGTGVPTGGDMYRVSYTGTSCVGPIQGTETLRLASTAPSPAPAPAPTPSPAPAPGPAPAAAGSDMFDPHLATVYASPKDVANWPITAKITALDFAPNGVAVAFTKKDGAGRWPDVTPPGWDGPIQYTLWMMVNHNGQVVTAGGIEFWHGLARSGGPPPQFASNWYYNAAVWGPLAQHQPTVGEQVGFFVTAGDHRLKDVRAVTERSNVVIVRFPSDAGGYFPF